MPELKANYDEHFILHYPDGAPAKNLKYKITASNGQVYQGTSDENGKTKMCNSDSMESLKIEIFTDE